MTQDTVQPQSGFDVDIVVIGGGMVGGGFALAASRFASVRVLDAAPAPVLPEPNCSIVDVDPRVSALTRASEQLLRHLGAWDAIAAGGICRYQAMDVWEEDGTGNIQFEASSIGEPDIGVIVENRLIQHALFSRAQQAGASLEWSNGVRVEQIRPLSPGYEVRINGQTLRCRLLVGADGAHSWVRSQANIPVQEKDFQHTAIVATIQTEKPHQGIARQRFLETGPLALLPLQSTQPDQHWASIVWSAEPDRAKALLSLDDAAFCEALAAASEYRLGAVQSVSQRFSFPLVQRHASAYIQPGLALIGDAAHTVHPLAGQGVNLGFLDAACLAEQLEKAAHKSLPINSLSVLRKYERTRRSHNTLMMNLFAGFKGLYGETLLPVRWARNTGMGFVNRQAWLKQHLLLRAVGLAGDLPDLCRP